MLTLIVVFLFVTMGLFEILRSRVLIIFANQMDQNLSGRVYDAIFKLAARNPSKTTSQAMSDINTLKQYLSGNGVFAFLDAPWLPIYIAILFLGLYFEGGASAVAAKQALSTGQYALIFWIGVVGLGLLTPITIALTALKNHAYRVGYIIANSLVVICGVVMLRYYIVYAGQVFTGA